MGHIENIYLYTAWTNCIKLASFYKMELAYTIIKTPTYQ